MARYSLTSYLLTVTIPTTLATEFGASTITVGGTESYLDNITLSYSESQWSTTGDATGSWVHNKSNNRTGTVNVTLSMLSDQVALFKRLCNIFYNSNEDYEGLTLGLSTLDGTQVATCIDCYLTKIPDQQFQKEAQTQEWSFTCGQITLL